MVASLVFVEALVVVLGMGVREKLMEIELILVNFAVGLEAVFVVASAMVVFAVVAAVVVVKAVQDIGKKLEGDVRVVVELLLLLVVALLRVAGAVVVAAAWGSVAVKRFFIRIDFYMHHNLPITKIWNAFERIQHVRSLGDAKKATEHLGSTCWR